MIKKATRSPILSALLSSVLLLAMLGAFSIFARSTFADEGIELAGTPSCDHIPDGCTSYGCNGTPGNWSCSLSGTGCHSGGSCTVR